MKSNKSKKGKLVPEEVDSNADDVVFEPEQEAKSTFGAKSESSQVSKLKKQLKEAKQNAKDNLDGWQRLKADMANSKKAEAERLARAKESGAQEVLESLLPALDSFDSAMQGSSWGSIDSAWRQGMEFVYSQLVGALESHGITSYGNVGDTFNETEHEAAEHQEVESESEANKIIKVLRKGYKSKDKVIRPARVIVGDFKS